MICKCNICLCVFVCVYVDRWALTLPIFVPDVVYIWCAYGVHMGYGGVCVCICVCVCVCTHVGERV